MRIGVSAGRRWLAAGVVASVVALVAGASAGSAATSDGFAALTGSEARAFALPADIEAVRTLGLPGGISYTRYQQVLAGSGAEVLGAQLSVYERGGEVTAVIGAYFDGIEPANTIQQTKGNARATVHRDIGQGGTRTTILAVSGSGAGSRSESTATRSNVHRARRDFLQTGRWNKSRSG